MANDALVRLFGFPATLVHSDTMVLDRWLFLRRHLPRIREGSKFLVEIGCGSGAFTIGAAKRGYAALGLSWDERNQRVAEIRAAICAAKTAAFDVYDVRCLDRRDDLRGRCDVLVCCETIEHIIDDSKLMTDMGRCLKPGGTLLLTAPNFDFRSIGCDEGPFLPIEDGRHVRRGYKKEDLERLCGVAGLEVCEIGYCSGYLSQKIGLIQHRLSKIHPLITWAMLAPLRVLPPLFDRYIDAMSHWPGYCITLVARKP
jgi:SAM-dependent methyltransferase